MNKSHNTLIRLFTFASAVGLAAAAHATVLDLGSSGSGSLNGALFSTTDIQPTGTGVFNPFLSIQNSPWEQGYNSSTGNFDTKREPQWNHEIRLSDLQTTTINGMNYFGFVVDVNEPGGSKATISLNDLRLYVSPTTQTSQSVNSSGFFNGSLGTLVYSLGSGNSIDYTDAQHGSGSGDINIFIPASNFAGFNSNDYVYMFQRWGNADASQGGFEETAIRQGIAPVPEVASFYPVIGLIAAVDSTHVLRLKNQNGSDIA